MRRIRHVLQLHFGAHASARVIAREVGVGRSTVQDYLTRAAAAALNWPLAPELTDEVLERLLFPSPSSKPGARHYPEPDWADLVREMKRPGVNLSVLFEEYQEVHPEGYRYSRFCELYRLFERRLSPTMRQNHVAGHKAFVDYSGKKVAIADPLTGEVRMAEIFVAVLGASSLTYAEATWTQSLPDWIGAHVRMFRFFGSAPRLLVPDNLKSGVNKSSFYDPEINRSYGKLAAHYNVGVVPARPRKPKDKAAVEAGVRSAQSYILGRLRNVTFFSLAECNAAIGVALERMNGREMRRLGVSRRQLFETIERRSCSPCQTRSTNMPNGASPASASTTMLRSMASSTRCRTRCSASRWTPAPRRAPSRYFTAASGSRAMRADTAVRVTERCPTTCPARTGATPNGRPSGSPGRPATSAPTRKL